MLTDRDARWLCLVVIVIASFDLHICEADGGVEGYKRVCYYTNWSQYRPGVGKYTPNNINAKLCTHIIYAFAKVVNSRIETVEWNDAVMFKKLQHLKASNPDLKTLIAVGGWNARSTEFSRMVKSNDNRAKFIQSTLSFLVKYGFDGLDLDWEYPTERGGRPNDKNNFVLLVQEMKHKYAMKKYLLTAAVPAGKHHITAGYHVQQIAKNLDFINLMTYDLHGAWDNTTGENSPLYAGSTDIGAKRQLNMKWAADYWVKKGAPRNKLIIGMAMYGRTFILTDPKQNTMGAPARGAGAAARYTREAGFMAYYEICQMQETGVGITRWDDEQKVPYYVNGRLWVGFDNVRSITEKVQWLKSGGYGGVMIWSLDLDDFRRVCKSSSRPYPLLSLINYLLTSGKPQTTKVTPTHTTTPTTPATTTTSHGKDFKCTNRATGFYADPDSCSKFYRCVNNRMFHYSCPASLFYNPKTKSCDWQKNVDCKVDFYVY